MAAVLDFLRKLSGIKLELSDAISRMVFSQL